MDDHVAAQLAQTARTARAVGLSVLGIAYLLRAQGPDGTWVDSRWNGTGFPRVFFLKYHYYAKYFPLWALGVYRHSAA
jgi:squalene cyclase